MPGTSCYNFKDIFAKKLVCLTQNKAKLCQKLIITLVFQENAIFFAENWQKMKEIVIITSTPGPDKGCQISVGANKSKPKEG
jgi:hypothetical protein